MASDNPYISSDLPPEPPLRRQGMEEIQGELEGTRTWVFIFAILGFIFGGFMLLAAIGAGGVFAFAGAAMGVENEFGAAGGMAMGLLIFLGYGAMSLFYLIPSWLLYKYASAIGRIGSQGYPAIVEALSQQRKFWKLLGIMFLVMILLYIILIVVMVGFGMFAGIMAG